MSSVLTIALMVILSSLFAKYSYCSFLIQSLLLFLIIIGGFLGFFVFSKFTKAFDYQDFWPSV